MKKLLAIARREVIEKKFVFAAALAVSAIVPLLPVLRGMTGSPAREMRGFLAVFAGWSFVAAVAAALGASALAGEIARGHGGFYFSRPLSSVSIWGGKLAGSLGIVLAAGLIVAAPTLLIDRRLDPLVDLAGSTWRGLLLAAAAALLLFLASHAIATMLRSRSTLALADLLLAAAVGFLTWDALRRLYELWPDPAAVLWRLGTGGAAVVAAVLVAGMHRGVSRGRTDPRAAHRWLSATIWSGLLAAALGLTIYSRWVLGAPVSALDSFGETSRLGADGWVALDGVARGARAWFLYDTRTGRSQRVFGSPVVVSADGSTAAWAERDSRREPWIVRTLRLDQPSADVRETKLSLKHSQRMFLSADGSRVGSVEEGLLSVNEIPSGKLVASARIGRPSIRASGEFVGSNVVRIYATVSDNEDSLEILEFDLARRALAHMGRADSLRAWYWASPLHDRFVDRDRERRVWTLRDGRTGAALATLREGGPVSYGTAVALSDGRWALLLADDSGSWIESFSPAGERVSRIAIGPKGSLRASGEVAPGRLGVALTVPPSGPGRSPQRALFVADLDRGTAVRSAESLRPIPGWTPAVIPPGSEATKLYVDESNRLVRFDPVTGERRVLLGGR